MRAAREHSTELFRQAEVLAAQFKRRIDWEYVRSQAEYERVPPLYSQLRSQILTKSPKRNGRGRAEVERMPKKNRIRAR